MSASSGKVEGGGNRICADLVKCERDGWRQVCEDKSEVIIRLNARIAGLEAALREIASWVNLHPVCAIAKAAIEGTEYPYPFAIVGGSKVADAETSSPPPAEVEVLKSPSGGEAVTVMDVFNETRRENIHFDLAGTKFQAVISNFRGRKWLSELKQKIARGNSYGAVWKRIFPAFKLSANAKKALAHLHADHRGDISEEN